MSGMDRVLLMKIHMVLAAVMLPAVLMFAITGGLYIWETKGSYKTETHAVALQAPLTADLNALTALTRKELATRGVDEPTGKPRVRKAGSSFMFEWTGADHDVVLEPGADATQAKLQVKQASFYQRLVQLHKAKGGILFKIYASAFAISLLLVVLSGVIMAWQLPKYRRLMMVSTVVGLVIFAFEVGLS